MQNQRGRFLIRAGLTLVVVGVLGMLLPLVGLQLRQLRGIPLGPWVGVPFLAIGLGLIGLGVLRRRHPRLVKFGAVGVGVLAIGFVVLAVAAPSVLNPRSPRGPRAPLPKPMQERLADAQHGQDPASTDGLSPQSARERRRPERPERTVYENEWTITVSGVESYAQARKVLDAVYALLPKNGRSSSMDHSNATATIRIGPIDDVPSMRTVLATFGEVTLDEASRSAKLRIDES